jgi:predicted dehydrogenase
LAAEVEAALARFVPLPEGYAGQFLRLYRALGAGAAPPVTLADARASIELATALYASARSGAPVALPLGPEHPLYGGWLP